jgi:hypothetical protein
MNQFSISAIFAAALLATAAAAAAPAPSFDRGASATTAQETVAARKPQAGDDRGVHGGGHGVSDEAPTSVENRRPHD